jgi:hypothetical protein
MSDDLNIAERLGAALDHHAARIEPAADLLVRVQRRRRQRRRRRSASVAVAVIGVVALITAGIVRFDHASDVTVETPTSSVPTSVPRLSASPMGGPVRLLPPAGASISRLTTYTSRTDDTYQQLYVGDQATDPVELLVETVDVAQGRPATSRLSTGTWPNRHTVQIGRIATNQVADGSQIFAWWTQPNRVEVDITATGLSAPQLDKLLRHARPSAHDRLGFVLGRHLPAGLRLLRRALSEQTNVYLEDVQYHQGGCSAELDVWSGIGQTLGGPPDTTRLISFDGKPAFLITGAGGLLEWTAKPGVTAELYGGRKCSLIALARTVHHVTTAQFKARQARLGNRSQSVTENPASAPTTTYPDNSPTSQ